MAQTDRSPIEEMRDAIARIERALLGDLITGSPGLVERQRKTEDRLDEHHRRLERQSERLHALEQAGSDRMRWTLRTVWEQGLRAGAAAAVGALAAIFANKPPHP